MHAIFSVFRKEFRENLRDRRTVISALIFGPLFGPLLFGATLSMSIEHGTAESDRIVTLAVSHAERAPNLVAYLQQYRVKVEQVSFDDAAARAAVKEHRRPMLLLIADDFGTRLSASEPAPLSLYVDSSYAANAKVVARIRNLLSQYGGLLARLRVLARGIDPLVLSPIVVRDIDVSTPASRSVLALGTLSYLVLLTMLMGGMYLAIDATAGERERGSLEPLLTVPVRREHLIYGKMLATCAYMTLSLSLTVTAFAIVLQFAGLERFGMSVNFGAGVALRIVVLCLPLVPLGAALMTIVAAFTRSYREAQTYLGILMIVPAIPSVLLAVTPVKTASWMYAVPLLSQQVGITELLTGGSMTAGEVLTSLLCGFAIAILMLAVTARVYGSERLAISV